MNRTKFAVAMTVALLLAATVNTASAAAGMSEASEASAVGTASIVAGSLVAAADGSQMVIEAVQDIGSGLKVTLRGSAQTARAVLILPLKLAGSASLAVGQTVLVIAHGAGWLITQAGKVLAFVPNEAGKALLFSRPAHGAEMRALLLLLALAAAPLHAGQTCEEKPVSANAMDQALRMAQQVQAALEQAHARAAIIARVGSDVSRYGLRYTHTGLVYRRSEADAWTVFHKLNHCGREDAELFSQGLGNFWLDDPQEYRALMLVPSAALQEQLLAALGNTAAEVVNQPNYSVIAYPYSLDRQNSNGWTLEMLAVAEAGGAVTSRAQALDFLQRTGYRPSIIGIAPHERLGASLFKANVSFLDHPLGERLRGRYSVVTAESIAQRLAERGELQSSRELALDAN